MKPKVSVIIPIYNVEKYLRECLDSAINQTMKDIEIICVNDGSPDKCGSIVDEYAARDSRIVAVHQQNSGYGRAVNLGIELAAGEYIAILESDDWVEPTMYEKLYNNAIANNSDVVKCSFYIYNSTVKNKKYQSRPLKVNYMDLFDAPDGAFTLKDFPQIAMFHSSVWASLYRADFVKQVKFIEAGKTMYQDFPFMCETLSKANRISVEKDYLLHYRMEEGQNSSTKKISEKQIQMASRCIDGIEILKKNNTFDFVREDIYFHAFMANLGFFRSISKEFKRAYFEELHRLFAPLANEKTFVFKYFKRKHKQTCKAIIANDFRRTVRIIHFSAGTVRRMILALNMPFFNDLFNIGKSTCRDYSWNLQILGFQFGDGVREELPHFRHFIFRGYKQ